MVGHFDVTRDGRRFLVVTVSEETAAGAVPVVLNWTEESKKCFRIIREIRGQFFSVALCLCGQ